MAELDVTHCGSIDGHGSDFEFEPPDKQRTPSGKVVAVIYQRVV